MTTANQIVVDGVTYVREQPRPGKRAVVVVDRGWIFAGDVERKDGRIRITRALWVFRWESVGFDGVLKDPASKQVTIKKLDHDVDLPADAEVFSVPVEDTWGL